jgi:hypothetical protein
MITNLVCNSEVIQNVCKGDCKIETTMGARNFDDIEQEANWYAFMLKVYSDCN